MILQLPHVGTPMLFTDLTQPAASVRLSLGGELESFCNTALETKF